PSQWPLRGDGDGRGAMSKIPAGVGPKLPQIVVLFGATGDLSQRKLLPGPYHLAPAGLIPHCSLIGASLHDTHVPAFRAIALKTAVVKADDAYKGGAQLLHYLSVPPNAALAAVQMIAEASLVDDSHIVMEKPFGTDLESAVALNARLHAVFAESQIFRIDHF